MAPTSCCGILSHIHTYKGTIFTQSCTDDCRLEAWCAHCILWRVHLSESRHALEHTHCQVLTASPVSSTLFNVSPATQQSGATCNWAVARDRSSLQATGQGRTCATACASSSRPSLASREARRRPSRLASCASFPSWAACVHAFTPGPHSEQLGCQGSILHCPNGQARTPCFAHHDKQRASTSDKRTR